MSADLKLVTALLKGTAVMTQPDSIPREHMIAVIHPAGRGLVLEGTSWQELEAFHRRLVADDGWACQPLLDLVTHIATAPYAAFLHAKTSLATLHVHGYTPFQWGHEAVMIECRGTTLVFTYRESPYRPVAWEKTCSAEESLYAFEHLVIDLLK